MNRRLFNLSPARAKRTVRLFLIFSPLLVLALAATSARYSVRLSLILHGRPFASVVPKAGLNLTRLVSSDSLRCQAIVFEDGQAIGWIYQPMFNLAHFVPFSAKPNVTDSGFDVWFDLFTPLAWSARWWLLLAQLVILLLRFIRSRPHQHGCCATCGYDLRATPERCPECGMVQKTEQISN